MTRADLATVTVRPQQARDLRPFLIAGTTAATTLVLLLVAGAHGWLWPDRRLATGLAVVVVLLGPASMAMHATQSVPGGRLDLLSMYLIGGFAAAYA